MSEIDTAFYRAEFDKGLGTDVHWLASEVGALLDEIDRLRLALAAAREDASERTWERDHASASYHRVRDELAALQAKYYALPADVRGPS